MSKLPVCPWCGKVDNDWWDADALHNDEDTAIFTCENENCEKEYEVHMHVELKFSSRKIKE
jgi:hypothetical protein